MELLVLDPSFISVAELDTYESIIWSDRYSKFGDFEIYIKASQEAFETLREDNYLLQRDSEHVMIIENHKITFDSESGNHLIVTGRSLETILERRIIWNQTVLTGSLQNGIQQLLNENAISPTLPERVIPNLVFEASTDPAITELTVDAQYMGDNLYTTIEKLCSTNNIGFKITLSETNQLIFKLYAGVNRSYEQFENSYVVFSPKFENIINSSYSLSKKNVKNVTLVMGEESGDIGIPRKIVTVGTETELNRREIYTDASSMSQTVDDVYMTDEEYIAQLTQKGNEVLDKNKIDKSFDGQVDTTRMFKYGEDFKMGDIVQLVSDYGIEGQARVIEMIHSQSDQGISSYPTFQMI